MRYLSGNTRPFSSLLLAVFVVIVAAGCGTSEPDGTASAADATTRPTATSTTASGPAPVQGLTVDQMATAVGCVPEPTVKAADFRQALCVAPKGKLVLLDFDTAAGMRAWLDTALMYGGLYLVGERWVLSAETVEYMETLQSQWGGTIEGRR